MNNLNQHPGYRLATAEQLGLIATPPLLDSFPVTVGEYTWHEFSVTCNVCAEKIEREHLHGRIDRSEFAVVLVDAIGFCSSCGVHSVASLKLTDNGVLLVLIDGMWQVQSITTSFWKYFSQRMDL